MCGLGGGGGGGGQSVSKYGCYTCRSNFEVLVQAMSSKFDFDAHTAPPVAGTFAANIAEFTAGLCAKNVNPFTASSLIHSLFLSDQRQMPSQTVQAKIVYLWVS